MKLLPRASSSQREYVIVFCSLHHLQPHWHLRQPAFNSHRSVVFAYRTAAAEDFCARVKNVECRLLSQMVGDLPNKLF
jgi:hypothetical protein